MIKINGTNILMKYRAKIAAASFKATTSRDIDVRHCRVTLTSCLLMSQDTDCTLSLGPDRADCLLENADFPTWYFEICLNDRYSFAAMTVYSVQVRRIPELIRTLNMLNSVRFWKGVGLNVTLTVRNIHATYAPRPIPYSLLSFSRNVNGQNTARNRSIAMTPKIEKYVIFVEFWSRKTICLK